MLNRLVLLSCVALACVGPRAQPGDDGRGRSIDRPVIGSTEGDMVCSTDRDCVLVEDGDCCGCTAGGVRGVVRGDRLEAVSAGRLEVCGELVMCPTVMSNDRSCRGQVQAVCRRGRCMIRRPRQ